MPWRESAVTPRRMRNLLYRRLSTWMHWNILTWFHAKDTQLCQHRAIEASSVKSWLWCLSIQYASSHVVSVWLVTSPVKRQTPNRFCCSCIAERFRVGRAGVLDQDVKSHERAASAWTVEGALWWSEGAALSWTYSTGSQVLPPP